MSGTFRDWLAGTDETGELQAIIDAERAEALKGHTYGVFLRGALIGTSGFFHLAEIIVADEADASNIPRSAFRIEYLSGAVAA